MMIELTPIVVNGVKIRQFAHPDWIKRIAAAEMASRTRNVHKVIEAERNRAPRKRIPPQNASR